MGKPGISVMAEYEPLKAIRENTGIARMGTMAAGIQVIDSRPRRASRAITGSWGVRRRAP